MKKILIATLYGHDSIIKTLIENKPFDEIIILKDLENNKIQEKSFEYIKPIIKTQNIKIIEIKIPLYEIINIAEMIKKIFEKNIDNEIYIDITHSRRTQAIAILQTINIIYPKNLKKIIYYCKDDNALINIPIIKSEKLNESEILSLNYIFKNKYFLQKDLASYINLSIAQVSRILEKLKDENFIKNKDGYFLTEKGQLFLTLSNNSLQ